MNEREWLIELLGETPGIGWSPSAREMVADHLLANGVTVREEAYWQYDEDDIDSDNNIPSHCSKCFAEDKHAVGMIGKVPFCWKCGSRMMPQPPKEE